MVSLAAPKVSIPAGPRQIVQAHVTMAALIDKKGRNSVSLTKKSISLSLERKTDGPNTNPVGSKATGILKTQGSLAYAS